MNAIHHPPSLHLFSPLPSQDILTSDPSTRIESWINQQVAESAATSLENTVDQSIVHTVKVY